MRNITAIRPQSPHNTYKLRYIAFLGDIIHKLNDRAHTLGVHLHTTNYSTNTTSAKCILFLPLKLFVLGFLVNY